MLYKAGTCQTTADHPQQIIHTTAASMQSVASSYAIQLSKQLLHLTHLNHNAFIKPGFVLPATSASSSSTRQGTLSFLLCILLLFLHQLLKLALWPACSCLCGRQSAAQVCDNVSCRHTLVPNANNERPCCRLNNLDAEAVAQLEPSQSKVLQQPGGISAGCRQWQYRATCVVHVHTDRSCIKQDMLPHLLSSPKAELSLGAIGGLPLVLSGTADMREILRGCPSLSSLCSSPPFGTSAGPSSTLANFCARSI